MGRLAKSYNLDAVSSALRKMGEVPLWDALPGTQHKHTCKKFNGFVNVWTSKGTVMTQGSDEAAIQLALRRALGEIPGAMGHSQPEASSRVAPAGQHAGIQFVPAGGVVRSQAPAAVSVAAVAGSGPSWVLYTDGSCPNNRNVRSIAFSAAGWGVAIFQTPRGGGAETLRADLYGPVVCDAQSALSLGAEVGSNNTGELSAIGEALYWLRDEAPEPRNTPAVINYDSEYAANIAQCKCKAAKNIDLALKVQALFMAVKAQRPLSFKHVKGHAGNIGNERADTLATRGATGEYSFTSARWSRALGSISIAGGGSGSARHLMEKRAVANGIAARLVSGASPAGNARPSTTIATAVAPSKGSAAAAGRAVQSWVIYTDGSCPNNRNVRACAFNAAGWGAAIFQRCLNGNETPHADLYGPVVCDAQSALSLGAEVGSNNTGELSAIGEALLWLRDEASEPRNAPAVIKYDSQYAGNIAQCKYRAAKNLELAQKVQAVFKDVKKKLSLSFQHVKGHSGNVGNERADVLANRGASGAYSLTSARWKRALSDASPAVAPGLTVEASANGFAPHLMERRAAANGVATPSEAATTPAPSKEMRLPIASQSQSAPAHPNTSELPNAVAAMLEVTALEADLPSSSVNLPPAPAHPNPSELPNAVAAMLEVTASEADRPSSSVNLPPSLKFKRKLASVRATSIIDLGDSPPHKISRTISDAAL